MIPLIRSDIRFEEVKDDIEAILASGQLTTGPYVENFEREFADYVRVPYAVTTTSATTAMHMTLAARGLGPDDEVLVSDFTFPASGNVVVQTGATPVLVDCQPGRFDIDLDDARKKLTERTRAIVIVHPFGQPVGRDAIERFRSEAGVWILEDAACAIGAVTGGVHCGAIGEAAAFSFHPRKILTTGEGGMITTSDASLFERLTVLRSHGGRRGADGVEFVDNGFNYRMSEIQAALGLAQLRRIDAIVAERRRVAKLYLARLDRLDFVTVPMSGQLDECSFQSFVVMLADGINRNRASAQMREQGFETTLGTYAMHAHPAFARFGYAAGDLVHSACAQSQSLTLPLVKGMSVEDVDGVVAALRRAV